MGGNALKNVKTERKNLVDYNRIKTEILKSLQNHIFCKATYEAPEKDSFGDLDILYVSDSKIDIVDTIKKMFSPSEIVINGPVISFDYDSFQIDLIEAKSMEDFEIKMFYFSYGDFGSIIGKIINFYNLKFGEKGLWINIEKSIDGLSLGVNSNIGKNIILTSKPNEICDFLGLDYSKWLSGFVTQKQIFDWIISSKYFIKEIFLVNSHFDRLRMKSRIVYINFMKYICGDELTTEAKPEREKIQMYAINYFNKNEELDKIVQQTKFNEICKKKYNGKMFIDAGFTGKEISTIMKEFESAIQSSLHKPFLEWLDSMSEEQVNDKLQQFFSTKK